MCNKGHSFKGMRRQALSSVQGGLLKDSLELVKLKSNNGRSRYTIKPLEEKLSFDKGFYVFIRAVQLLLSHNPKGIVVVSFAVPFTNAETVTEFLVGQDKNSW